MADIVLEISRSMQIHTRLGYRLNGIHLAMTGDVDASGSSVTECLGGSMDLQASDLGIRYTSFCDPRLNADQSLDVAFLVSAFLQACLLFQQLFDTSLT